MPAPDREIKLKRRVFIGSSGEALGVCRAVQSELASEFEVTVWDQDVFQLSYGPLDALLDALDSSDAGVFVLRPDDLTTRRQASEWTVRDNVIFELGMFIGRLGRDRTFMLTPDKQPVHLPSDLLGLTTAVYDANRANGAQPRAAVAPACTQIRDRLSSLEQHVVEPSMSRARLDDAMARMGMDLEQLLGVAPSDEGGDAVPPSGICAQTRIGRATVQIEVGRIESHAVLDARTVIALPANEYFDDECAEDARSSLGAFVQHYLPGRAAEFVDGVRAHLDGMASERVPRAEGRIDDSYGIGHAILLKDFPDVPQVVVVSATTERTGIGLRAEPHFLYACVRAIIEKMNECRMSTLVMPVLGAGHGGMLLLPAVLFNLLALRACLTDAIGRKIRNVRIVVYEGSAADITTADLEEVVERVVGL